MLFRSATLAIVCLVTLTSGDAELFARGFGGGGGIGGGGARGGMGGGGARPAGNPGARPNFNAGAHPNFSAGAHPNFNAGAGAQHNFNSNINRTPSFSQPHINNVSPRVWQNNTRVNTGNVNHFGNNNFNQINRANVGINNQINRGNVGINNRTNNFNNINRGNINNINRGGNSVNVNHINRNSFNTWGGGTYRPSYANHSWYHGSWGGGVWHGPNGGSGAYWHGPGWHGGWGGGWGYGYGTGFWRPLGWGLGAWGLGSAYYASGYLPYSNPYYVAASGGVYDYSQPIPVAYNDPAYAQDQSPNADPNAAAAGNPSAAILDSAAAAFKQNDYPSALRIVDQGIQKYPSDAVMHEFRALVLFATGNYQQAAATLESVLAIGPGWDWTTLSSLYSDINVYTGQLRALEGFITQNPNDAAARFVLAYQYLTAGHAENAVHQLQEVVKLVPGDRVAADLLKMLTQPQGQPDSQGQPQSATLQQTDVAQQTGQFPGPRVVDIAPNQTLAGQTQPSVTPQPGSAVPAEKPIDPAALVGKWAASRTDGSKFELTIDKDTGYAWTFSQGANKQSFTGTYSLEGNILILARKEGGTLPGEVTFKDPRSFNFKAVGAPSDDPGLDFRR